MNVFISAVQSEPRAARFPTKAFLKIGVFSFFVA
jgi:hypothetical protein